MRSDRYNIFGIFGIKMQSKKQSKIKVMGIDMMRIDPGDIGFTSGFSQGHKYSTVGEQITIEKLTELSIVLSISTYDHVYRHHVRDK